jgi:uncharacterized protein YjbI with pentapeptide repeats
MGDPHKKPLGYRPPKSAKELLERYAAGERYFNNGDLPIADLTGANLTGANLAFSDLAGAKLAGSTLANANFYGATLIEALLCDTNLSQFDSFGCQAR